MQHIYLDHNASTPIDPRVLNVLIKQLKEEVGNPSSVHAHGRLCRTNLQESRNKIAQFFSVRPQEVVFTSGGTEGAALLILGIKEQNSKGHIISSAIEHSSVFLNLKAMEKKGGQVTFLNPGIKGAVAAADVENAIRENTALISIIAVNNETGVKTDIEAIAEIAKRHRIPFVVDGVAWLGKEIFTIPDGVSAIFFSGHKIHAPKGVGFYISRSSLKLSPLYAGGGQELNRRPGTENLPAICALAEAISLLTKDQTHSIEHMKTMRDLLEKQLMSNLSDVQINGTGLRICNTSNLAFLGVSGETLLMNLDLEKISVSHGSACSSGALEPSRVLLEMGIPPKIANSSIRFSVGRTTTLQEIERASEIIIKVVKRLRG